MKKNILFTFILSFSFSLSAQATDQVGLVIYDGKDSFVSNLSQSLEKKLINQNVDVLFYDSKNSQEQQNAQVDHLIDKKVKALIINLVNPEAGSTIIEKAKEANIPIIFFNKDPGRKVINSYKKSYYIGADPVQSGIIQGDLIAKGWKRNPDWDLNGDGTLQFVLLRGQKGHPDAKARSEWVVKELLQNHISVEKLFESSGNWSEKEGKEITDMWLKGPKAKQIEMVIANNDAMAIGARMAIKEHGRSIPVYGVDAIPQALTMISNGELEGTVLNDSLSQAWAISQILPSLMLGSTPDEYIGYSFNNRYLRIPYIAVDRDNLDEFLKKD